jgi:crotonobetainyl-CoA:carnitine CoA-transferase CaiB-like acyl-CoA transferase
MSTTCLEGIRVLDLRRAWAGPLACRIFGDLGAEVIRVEFLMARGWGLDFSNSPGIDERIASRKPGELPESELRSGIFPNGDPRPDYWNRQGPYNEINRNKLGVTLELNKPQGVEIFKRLVKISDVVLDNYSPRVMKNFGLDYPVLREVNPAIIMIAMPGFGMTGPHRDYLSWGPIAESASGHPSLVGYPDGGPMKYGLAYTDGIGGLNAASAVLIALWQRRKTGEGQFIDLAQTEGFISLIGEAILGFSMNGKVPPRSGNRHSSMAPHGCYPCKGEDRWVAIAIATDNEWRAFCSAIGNPPWSQDGKFADQTSRWKNQDELDRLISQWTIGHEHYEAMHILQEAGVAAGAVLDNREIVEEPHLQARNYYAEIEQPGIGTHPYPGNPIRVSKTPRTTFLPTPTMGEHNEYVLGELLSLSREEMAQLEKDGIIGTGPPDAPETEE